MKEKNLTAVILSNEEQYEQLRDKGYPLINTSEAGWCEQIMQYPNLIICANLGIDGTISPLGGYKLLRLLIEQDIIMDKRIAMVCFDNLPTANDSRTTALMRVVPAEKLPCQSTCWELRLRTLSSGFKSGKLIAQQYASNLTVAKQKISLTNVLKKVSRAAMFW